MGKFYITFGQIHTHSVNGKTFDKDCLAEIEAETKEEAHKQAMETFDGVFHQTLSVDEARKALHYFPRGMIKV